MEYKAALAAAALEYLGVCHAAGWFVPMQVNGKIGSMGWVEIHAAHLPVACDDFHDPYVNGDPNRSLKSISTIHSHILVTIGSIGPTFTPSGSCRGWQTCGKDANLPRGNRPV
ncbi:MAG: hypothetical protein PVG22_11965 [Chromatiales bacterium]|jgi:hypothetical protein